MFSRGWRVLHPLLTLAAVAGCGWLLWREYRRPDPPPAVAGLLARGEAVDDPLRHLLGVRWLGGEVELPADANYWVPLVLKFEDGRFAGEFGGRAVISVRPGESRVVPLHLLWAAGPVGPRAAVGRSGVWVSGADPFFARLDGGLSRGSVAAPDDTFRGWRVIGYATSEAARPGRENDWSVGTVGEAVAVRRAVVVLAVRAFPTAETARDWMENRREPLDP